MNDTILEELKSENERLKQELLDLKRKESENIYKLFVDHFPDIFIMVDPQYRYQYLHIPNVPRERLDAMVGRDLITTTPEIFRPKMVEALKKVFEEKVTVNYESEGEAMGSYKYLLNYLSPIFDKDNQVTSAYFISRDITHRKVSEKAIGSLEEKLRIMFESIKHIYTIFDLNQTVLWFNEEARISAKSSFNVDMKIGMHASELFPARFSKFKEYFDRALHGEVVKYNSNHAVVRDQRKLSLNIIFQPIYDHGKLIAVANIAVDVTELADKEENSEKLNKELVLQNQRLYQYSHVISHNLRSPIATLMGIVNVVEEFKEDKPLVNQLLGKLRTTALKLDTIIQDLNLILNQTSKETVSTQRVNLSDLVDGIIELMGNIKDQGVEIQYNFKEVPEIVSVKGYLHSIMYNLISNSVKYKKINEPCLVKISSKKTDEGMVCIEVSDNGMGIDLQQYGTKLFGFYKRFHGHVEGKGIGLNITRTQVEILGGKITVESQVNVGSTFRVYLPV
jgi:hypothetical protein